MLTSCVRAASVVVMRTDRTPSALAKRLERLRGFAGISARKLSMLAGMSHSALGQLLRGDHDGLKAESAAALADVLGVTLEYLLRGEGREPGENAVRAAVADAEARKATEAA